MALEERIGNVSTGLSEETILNHLRQRKYSIAMGSPLEREPCCVCQVSVTNLTHVGGVGGWCCGGGGGGGVGIGFLLFA